MGHESGQVSEFDLTFAATGSFESLCVVYGSVMAVELVVVRPDETAHIVGFTGRYRGEPQRSRNRVSTEVATRFLPVRLD